MKDFVYYSPTKLIFGKNKETEVGSIINEYGFKNILMVIGKSSVKKSGLFDKVISSISEFNIKINVLEGVEPNPKVDLVRNGTIVAKNNKVDFILAIGGGSVIDTAKAIACAYYLDCDPWCLNDHSVKPLKALPIGVILTIFAAGSELSNSCVISNPKLKLKNGFNSDLIRPLFAIEDPLLTNGVSKYQIACGIVDIMMHTLERYLNEVEDAYLTDELALGLLKSVYKAALILKNDFYNYEARSTLMLASSFAHNGLTGMGESFYFTVHRLEHQLSGIKDEVTHGAGLALLFPAWSLYVYEKLPNKFATLAKALFDIKEVDNLKCAKEGILKLKDFFASLDLPVHLDAYGITDEEIDFMATRATNNPAQVQAGFVNLTKQDIINIFELCK